MTVINPNQTQQAIVAGGCFWCIESAFNIVKGIHSAISGYMGGQTDDPTYEDICSGTTGHAEVINISFDPSVISFREILEIFFSLHNPTQLNRQGHDVGTQYRSAIFFTNKEQEKTARNIITEINNNKVWPEPIVTEVVEQSKFYSGEEFHQDYFNKNAESQYCQVMVSPKLAKFKQTFVKMLK